jgi:DNA ligase 1
MKNLIDLQNFVTEANQSNSNNEKLEVVKKYPQCQELWKWTYDTINYQFGLTSTNIIKLKSKIDPSTTITYKDIVDLLKDLSNKVITGHDAIRAVITFVNQNPSFEEIIFNIIDRNLKTRIDIKQVNKIFPNCIPQFEVALAKDICDYDPERSKINFSKNEWFASRKMDGVRCLAICYPNGSVKLFSRQGKEFMTLDKVKHEIESLNVRNIVFDGEICLVDKYGNEDFQNIMKEIRRKDHTIERPKYQLFDCLTLEEFSNGSGSTSLTNRLNVLKGILKSEQSLILNPINQIKVESWEHIDQMMNDAMKNGWEGLIVRKNCSYSGKRSNEMLKVKYFKDSEFIVENVEMGLIRHIDYDEMGKSFEKEEQMLSAILINFKGNVVRVGSGFTMNERKHYYLHPNELIGKQVTVKYFEETQNQTGGNSVRFPTIKQIWNGARESEE